MDRHPRRRLWGTLFILAGVAAGCRERPAVEDLPSARDTMAAVGKRLGGERSLDDLTAIAARGDRVLAELTSAERDALGRGYLRFRVDRPVLLDVAASPRAIPFWLKDRGFTRTRETLAVSGEEWPVFRKAADAGWVGLGVNALDRAAPSHYVVFVRPVKGGPVSLDGIDRDAWRIARAVEGVSATFDVATPIERLPASLAGAELLQASRDRRHSTPLARGRIWKTHVASRPAPDQVAIAFGADAARSLTWTWRTAPEVTGTAVRLAPASPKGDGPADLKKVRVVRGESRPVGSPDLLNDPMIRRHRVRVSGLEPDTVYAYSLGDGMPAGWSPWRTVRTGPATPRDYRFLYLGDAQCGLEGWGALLREAVRRNPDAGFILLAGDLVDRGNERTNWDHFFLRAAGVFDAYPFLPCVGNHEYLDQGPRLYSAFFEPPRNGPEGIAPGLVYSFEYADAFFAILDSNLAIADRSLARLQADWLDEALSRTRARWRFVMFHHPIYASHKSREHLALRADWLPVFDKHHVDMVLQGHDHAYLRTFPMRGDRRVASNALGTTYVVSVSGDKFYEQDPRGYTEVGLTETSTYQTIDVDVSRLRLTYRAWDARGREVDRFVIDKAETLAARPAR